MFHNGKVSTNSQVLGDPESVGELLIPRFSYFFATAWWQWLLLPVAYMMAPIHGVIINWFAHIYGYTNFKVSDTSKNLLKFDWLMMGEAYHNNHHKHGGRANFGGVRWHEMDVTYQIMLLLDKMKLIKLNPVTAAKREH